MKNAYLTPRLSWDYWVQTAAYARSELTELTVLCRPLCILALSIGLWAKAKTLSSLLALSVDDLRSNWRGIQASTPHRCKLSKGKCKVTEVKCERLKPGSSWWKCQKQ